MVGVNFEIICDISNYNWHLEKRQLF